VTQIYRNNIESISNKTEGIFTTPFQKYNSTTPETEILTNTTSLHTDSTMPSINQTTTQISTTPEKEILTSTTSLPTDSTMPSINQTTTQKSATSDKVCAKTLFSDYFISIDINFSLTNETRKCEN